MAPIAAPPIYTPDDLLTMPDDVRYELVDGHLVESTVSNASVWIAGEMLGILWKYAQRGVRGFVFGDGLLLRCYPDDPDRVRRPDAAFFCAPRFSNDRFSEGFCTIVPDLAVEVVSPNDVFYDVERKAFEYLAAGVRLVWIVNPGSRTVFAYAGDGMIEHYNASQTLTGRDVLPGLEIPVASLFPPVL